MLIDIKIQSCAAESGLAADVKNISYYHLTGLEAQMPFHKLHVLVVYQSTIRNMVV